VLERERLVGDEVVREQLVAEVEERLLSSALSNTGTSRRRDRLDRRSRDAGVDGPVDVGVPRVLRVEVARSDEQRELPQTQRQARLEPDVRAERLDALARIRALDPDLKRTTNGATAAGDALADSRAAARSSSAGSIFSSRMVMSNIGTARQPETWAKAQGNDAAERRSVTATRSYARPAQRTGRTGTRGSMTRDELRDDLATATRILGRHEMIGMFGHVSLLTDDPDVGTSSVRAPVGARTSSGPDDMIELGLDDEFRFGLPLELYMHAAMHRAKPANPLARARALPQPDGARRDGGAAR
jgi:hypothetical protein